MTWAEKVRHKAIHKPVLPAAGSHLRLCKQEYGPVLKVVKINADSSPNLVEKYKV